MLQLFQAEDWEELAYHSEGTWIHVSDSIQKPLWPAKYLFPE